MSCLVCPFLLFKIAHPSLFSESHAKELQDGGYQLPQAVAILLADARRKEEKRQAKRIANRKSACTSRARKKAKIDQLMNENAQLRRLELILSYLPDPIIVVSTQGVITFCNAQVERVFKHKVSELVGANIEDVMIPKSRGVIKKLIRDVLAAEQELSEAGDDTKKNAVGDMSGSSSGHPFGKFEHGSESAFPLLEVKVNSTQVDAGEDVSDSDENRRHSPNGKKSSQAAATEISSLTHKGSSFNSNEGDDATPPAITRRRIRLKVMNQVIREMRTPTCRRTLRLASSTRTRTLRSVSLTRMM
jgi:PAS domain S-box-containing protein